MEQSRTSVVLSIGILFCYCAHIYNPVYGESTGTLTENNSSPSYSSSWKSSGISSYPSLTYSNSNNEVPSGGNNNYNQKNSNNRAQKAYNGGSSNNGNLQTGWGTSANSFDSSNSNSNNNYNSNGNYRHNNFVQDEYKAPSNHNYGGSGNNNNYHNQNEYKPKQRAKGGQELRQDIDEFKRLKKSLGNLKSAATPLAVPLFVPMIIIVGILLLLFFAVVGCATIAGGPVSHRHHPMYYTGRSLMASAKLAGDVLSSEECVERISCEIMKASKEFLPKRYSTKSRKIFGKPYSHSSRTGDCQKFKCNLITGFMNHF